jgi:hypothetical protein
MKKEITDQIQEAAKILRNCRKIEHRIYQLQKQLYLGHTTAYNIIMRLIYPNYDEHRKEMKKKHEGPLANNEKLNEMEANIGQYR